MKHIVPNRLSRQRAANILCPQAIHICANDSTVTFRTHQQRVDATGMGRHMKCEERRARGRTPLKFRGREVFDGPVCPCPAREERFVVEAATFVECEGEHARCVGQVSEIDRADGVDGLDGDFGVWGTGEGGEVAGVVVALQDAERVILDGLDVILVSEADDGRHFFKGAWLIHFGHVVAG